MNRILIGKKIIGLKLYCLSLILKKGDCNVFIDEPQNNIPNMLFISFKPSSH